MKYIPIIFVMLLLLGACRAKKDIPGSGEKLGKKVPIKPAWVDKIENKGILQVEAFLSEEIVFSKKDTVKIQGKLLEEDGGVLDEKTEKRDGGKVIIPKGAQGKIINAFKAQSTSTYRVEVSFNPDDVSQTLLFEGKAADSLLVIVPNQKYGPPDIKITKGKKAYLLCKFRSSFINDENYHDTNIIPGYGND